MTTNVLMIKPEHYSFSAAEWVDIEPALRADDMNPYLAAGSLIGDARPEPTGRVWTEVHQIADPTLSLWMWISEEGALHRWPINIIATVLYNSPRQLPMGGPLVPIHGPAVVAQRHMSYDEDVDELRSMDNESMLFINMCLSSPSMTNLKPVSDSINRQMVKGLN